MNNSLKEFSEFARAYIDDIAISSADIGTHLKHLDWKHLPDPDKVIRELEVPRTKTQLRSLLGLTNYYRDYIPNYAGIAHPLTELTKKRAPEIFDWKEIHQTAFQDLKDKL
ncbi:hypothetical protein AVEN_148582-1 [Araneus ventricosus]|uniref:RNA-directed DNA polymerase n=1 Tax=Araneus ventricosus TaxID=182803 RepID=A0A4Y2WCC5_ARAVE|nr:hypothetical protein AVEN_148582-1 [Araneus ventricosus]